MVIMHNLCFFSKIRKIMYTPVNPVLQYKSGFKGVKIILVCFRDETVVHGQMPCTAVSDLSVHHFPRPVGRFRVNSVPYVFN